MPETKHILVLANSIKNWPGSCIAGREIQFKFFSYKIGPWIRPVSSHGQGELSPREIQLTNRRQPRVFDFIKVSLAHPCNDPLQPENWLIDSRTQWRAANFLRRKPALDRILDEPDNLWLQKNETVDRVATAYLRRNPPKQSLYFVAVDNLRARFDYEQRSGSPKQRRRALFAYNGVDYEINITDPRFGERHRSKFPAKGQPEHTFAVSSKGKSHLCVSLTHDFHGYHYKVAATVFE